jgi:NADPH:quinone reductase-like Zn-dependent oxidoreductase
VSTDKKRDFLHQRFGLPHDRIFQSRDRSFVPSIKIATLNKGIDVILSAHTGDLLHDTWECMALFGRYVDIGRRDVLDHGRLNMNMFARHASFFSFDLGIIGWRKPELFQRCVAILYLILNLLLILNGNKGSLQRFSSNID